MNGLVELTVRLPAETTARWWRLCEVFGLNSDAELAFMIDNELLAAADGEWEVYTHTESFKHYLNKHVLGNIAGDIDPIKSFNAVMVNTTKVPEPETITIE